MEKHRLSKESWLDIFQLPAYIEYDFNELYSLHPEEHGEVMIYGKMVKIPRFQKSYLRDYNFSGNVAISSDLPESFAPFLKFVNSLEYGNFNQILLNWYPNGHSYIGSHSDDESQLVKDSPIITISLGAERNFRIRNKSTKKIVKNVTTKNKLVMVMGGK